MSHPTDMEIDKAIKALKKIIEAAENSNHAGEVLLMKAAAAITTKAPPSPPAAPEMLDLLERCERVFASGHFGHHCPADYRGLQIEIWAFLSRLVKAEGEAVA